MARTFTALQLIDRGREAADKENDEHIPLTEWKKYLSSAYAALYAILVESGWRYFESEDTITTDGNHSYALPADFLTSVGVDYEVNSSTGERRFLLPLEVQERNVFTGSSGSGEATHYALVGSNVRLYRTPPSGQTYYHVYVPQPTDLSSASDSDNVDVVTPDGEEFIVWHMAFKALHKEGSDTRDARQEREAARKRVYEWAVLRALNEPKRRIVAQNLGRQPLDPGDYWGRGGNW